MMVGVFIYLDNLCRRSAKALASLHICAHLSEASLLNNAISTKVSLRWLIHFSVACKPLFLDTHKK